MTFLPIFANDKRYTVYTFGPCRLRLPFVCLYKIPIKEDLYSVKNRISKPVLIGSGVTAANIGDYGDADGLIIGSEFKKDGFWANELDPSRIERITRFFN